MYFSNFQTNFCDIFSIKTNIEEALSFSSNFRYSSRFLLANQNTEILFGNFKANTFRSFYMIKTFNKNMKYTSRDLVKFSMKFVKQFRYLTGSEDFV